MPIIDQHLVEIGGDSSALRAEFARAQSAIDQASQRIRDALSGVGASGTEMGDRLTRSSEFAQRALQHLARVQDQAMASLGQTRTVVTAASQAVEAHGATVERVSLGAEAAARRWSAAEEAAAERVAAARSRLRDLVEERHDWFDHYGPSGFGDAEWRAGLDRDFGAARLEAALAFRAQYERTTSDSSDTVEHTARSFMRDPRWQQSGTVERLDPDDWRAQSDRLAATVDRINQAAAAAGNAAGAALTAIGEAGRPVLAAIEDAAGQAAEAVAGLFERQQDGADQAAQATARVAERVRDLGTASGEAARAARAALAESDAAVDAGRRRSDPVPSAANDDLERFGHGAAEAAEGADELSGSLQSVQNQLIVLGSGTGAAASRVLDWLRSIGPAGVTAAAVIGATAYVTHEAARAAEDAENRWRRFDAALVQAGNHVALSRGDFEELSRQVSSAYRIGEAEIGQIATRLVRNGPIDPSTLRQAIELGRGMADFAGGGVFAADAGTNAQRVAAALHDASAAIDLLHAAGVRLTADQEQMIRSMTAAKDAAGLQIAVLDRLRDALGGAGQNDGAAGAVHRLSEAWERLLRTMGQSGDQGTVLGRVFDQAGQGLSSWMDETTSALGGGGAAFQVAELQRQLERARAARDEVGRGYVFGLFGGADSPRYDQLDREVEALERQLQLARERLAVERQTAEETARRDAAENAASQAAAKGRDATTHFQEQLTALRATTDQYLNLGEAAGTAALRAQGFSDAQIEQLRGQGALNDALHAYRDALQGTDSAQTAATRAAVDGLLQQQAAQSAATSGAQAFFTTLAAGLPVMFALAAAAEASAGAIEKLRADFTARLNNLRASVTPAAPHIGSRSEDRVERAEADAASIARLAAAYGTLSVEQIREAEIQRQIDSQSVGVDASQRERLAVALRNQAAAQRLLDTNRLVLDIANETQANNRLIEAHGQGNAAVREATILNERDAEARRRGISVMDDEFAVIERAIRQRHQFADALAAKQFMGSAQNRQALAQWEAEQRAGAVGLTAQGAAVFEARLAVQRQAMEFNQAHPGFEIPQETIDGLAEAAAATTRLRHETEQLGQVWDTVWGTAANAIDQFVEQGRVSWSSLESTILSSLAKIASQAAETELFGEGGASSFLRGALGIGGSGGPGLLSGVGQWLGRQAYEVFGIGADYFHGGGEVGLTAVPRRTLPPELFVAAPRLHGGLMPDEFAAVLQKGEIVLPPGVRPAALQAPDIRAPDIRVPVAANRNTMNITIIAEPGTDLAAVEAAGYRGAMRAIGESSRNTGGYTMGQRQARVMKDAARVRQRNL